MRTYQLENDQVLVEFLALGGCITKLINKKTGINYILSYQDQRYYQQNPYFLGATVGRNAGRTFPAYYKNASGKNVILDTNEGNVHLHGGKKGLHQKFWQVEPIDRKTYQLFYHDVTSSYEPMDLCLQYRLEENIFSIEMWGTADQPTICNLTNHSYFNLNKNKHQTIENHRLMLTPAKIQVIDQQFIPTGKYAEKNSLSEKYFDFTEEKLVKEALKNEIALSRICADGIDLAYCFEKTATSPKIQLTSDDGENQLIITTNQEACVIYTLNKIAQSVKVNSGIPIKKYQGITFEMQRKPNYVHETTDYLTQDYHSLTHYQLY